MWQKVFKGQPYEFSRDRIIVIDNLFTEIGRYDFLSFPNTKYHFPLDISKSNQVRYDSLSIPTIGQSMRDHGISVLNFCLVKWFG